MKEKQTSMTQNVTVFERLKRLAERIHIDSLTLGPATIRFEPSSEPPTPAFAQIVDRLRKDKSKSSDVFAISAQNVDVTTVVDRIDAGHECEALGEPIRTAGGSGANTAYALAQLGFSVGVSGIVGDDSDGKMVCEEFVKVRADTELLLIAPQAPTGTTTTLVEKGGNRFIAVMPGINNKFTKSVDYERLVAKALAARILHLSSFVGNDEFRLQQRLVQQVSSKCLISLTPGALYARQGLDRLKSILRHVDVMFLYREQLQQLIENSSMGTIRKGTKSNDLLEVFFGWRARNHFDNPMIVVVKDPLESLSGQIRERFLSVGVGAESLEDAFSPQPMTKGVHIEAIDTTGAGDAAAAGFLCGLLRSAPLESCLDFAFLLATFASTELGARTALLGAKRLVQRSLPDFLPTPSQCLPQGGSRPNRT
jgi:ribokinase